MPGIEVVQVGVLLDRDYSWDQIRTDTTLAFAPADSLHPAQARRYWLRLTLRNPSRYAAAVRLRVQPALDNTLFDFDEDARVWRTRRAGRLVPTDRQWQKGQLPVRLPGQATTTCYVLLTLPAQAPLPRAIALNVQLQPGAADGAVAQWLGVVWAGALGLLGLLLLAGLVVYARSRDRATLYYCWTQVAGALYLVTMPDYFRAGWPNPVLSLLVLPNGWSYSFTSNSLLMHLSVALLLLGIGQMTRAYLRTPARLPRLDAGLRWAVAAYGAFTLVVVGVNMSGFHLDYYTLPVHNLLVLPVVGLVLAAAVVAYRQRLPSARPYLLATAPPLLLILLLAGYQAVAGFEDERRLLLPCLTVVAHGLCFAAALASRLYTLQRTLLAREHDAQQLALDIQAQELRHREIVLQNAHIQAALGRLEQQHQAREQHTRQLSADHERQQAANQELQEQLEANQRELASTSLYVQQKNALLAELKQELQELSGQRPGPQPELAGIKSLLQSSLHLDEDWDRFKRHFEQVHPRFFEELQAKYPALSSHEQRLYCYFHIHLSTKEIAALLNIDPASVRRAKTRLYKKIGAADLAAGRTPAPEESADEPAGE